MEVDTLLLVAGSALAVVVLGVLIYKTVPSSNSSRKSGATEPTPTADSRPKVESTNAKEVEASSPSGPLLASAADQFVAVSEAPPPFAEETIIVRKRRTARSALPTDTTALKGLANEAGNSSRILVISAPKRKVRAFRNATSPPTGAPRRRRTNPRALPVSSIPEATMGITEKQELPDNTGVSNNLSS